MVNDFKKLTEELLEEIDTELRAQNLQIEK